jgi:uncharacterized protein
MIDKELMKIIVCPINHQPLHEADRQLIDSLNRAVNAGLVKDHAGRPVTETLQEGLVRQDGLVLYPVRDNIPVLLADEGIPLDAIPH